MVSGKSTRWDCDVHLWRGIPDSFPSFYGWNSGGSAPSSIPTRDARFFVCHHCNTYVSDVDAPIHPCWDYRITGDNRDPPNNTPLNDSESLGSGSSEDGYVCDWDDWRKEEEEKRKKEFEAKPKYVIATEENCIDGKCSLCMEKLVLKFDHDEEDWIYPGCIHVDGKIAHEECHLILSGQKG